MNVRLFNFYDQDNKKRKHERDSERKRECGWKIETNDIRQRRFIWKYPKSSRFPDNFVAKLTQQQNNSLKRHKKISLIYSHMYDFFSFYPKQRSANIPE